MCISRTKDDKICIDIPKGNSVLAISVDRSSQIISKNTEEVDAASFLDHIPYGKYFETFHTENVKVAYDIQSSVNGAKSEVEHVSAGIKYEYSDKRGEGQSLVENGINPQEKEKIGKALFGKASWAYALWTAFVPTTDDIADKEKKKTNHGKVKNSKRDESDMGQQQFMAALKDFYTERS